MAPRKSQSQGIPSVSISLPIHRPHVLRHCAPYPLGAALSLLDAVYLPLNIPGITTRFVGYGLPRVGNQEFADYLDAQPTSVTHVNNKLDMVPILPGRFLGYHHPSGEIHIQASGQWLSCPGTPPYPPLCPDMADSGRCFQARTTRAPCVPPVT